MTYFSVFCSLHFSIYKPLPFNENIVVHQSYIKDFASVVILKFGFSLAQRPQETTVGIYWN